MSFIPIAEGKSSKSGAADDTLGEQVVRWLSGKSFSRACGCSTYHVCSGSSPQGFEREEVPFSGFLYHSAAIFW
jgi:hypothetical protein